MNKPTPAKGRKNVPLYVMLPPDERARLEAFAEQIERPFSWVVRDALRLYLDAAESDAPRMDRLRNPELDMSNAGKTEQPRPGKPRTKRR